MTQQEINKAQEIIDELVSACEKLTEENERLKKLNHTYKIAFQNLNTHKKELETELQAANTLLAEYELKLRKP